MTQQHHRVQEWYDANPARRTSGEADYGVHWGDGVTRQRYRVSYVQATGEVYAVGAYPPVEPVEVLGVVPPNDGTPYYRTLDALLDGWPEQCRMDHDGLAWVRKQLEGFLVGTLFLAAFDDVVTDLKEAALQAMAGELSDPALRELWESVLPAVETYQRALASRVPPDKE